MTGSVSLFWQLRGHLPHDNGTLTIRCMLCEICTASSTGYIHPQVTAAGYALCLEGGRDESEAAGGGHDDVKINLLDAKFKEDLRPLVEGCSCFTCCNHSRAYLYHLLTVHEMTAQVLLELHNVHQFLAFFRQLRAAISQQSFGQFHEAFLRRRAACRALEM